MAQLLDVGGAVLGFGGEKVIEEVDRILAGEGGGGPGGSDSRAQPQAVVHGQLAGGEGSGEVLRAVAQQGKDHGGGFRQRNLLIRAEGAVAEGGDQSPAYRRLHIAAGPVAPGDIRVGGGGRLAHTVPARGGFYRHGDKLRPGHPGGQVQIAAAVAVEDAQSSYRLDRVVQRGRRPRRRGGQYQGEGEAGR